MSRLERCHGHFYNWYDTQDLRPLEPRYVSSVDSGNLAAHLVTLANACDEMATGCPLPAQIFAGIGDSLALAQESFGRERRMPRLAQRSMLLHPAASCRRPASRPEPLAANLDALRDQGGCSGGADSAAGQRGWRRGQRRDRGLG